MLSIERLDEILEYLKKHKSASVATLAQTLHIGEASIRRDLKKLQSNGFVKRTYGGAVLVKGLDSEIPLYVREQERKSEKDIIGELAAQMVSDGDVIILDSSSTTYHMIKFLRNKKNLTVITNGAKTAIGLGELEQSKIFSTGGKLREFSLSYIGNTAQGFVENFYVDKLFFSCRAMSPERGVLDSSEEEAELRKTMLAHCTKAILLCDGSKFGGSAFYKICDAVRIDAIVTDRPPNDELAAFLLKNNIQVIY